jgi:hypothetical protein
MFKRILLAAVLFFTFSTTTPAQDVDIHVNVPKEKRVLNENNKRCVWCSIEVLAHTAKEDRLYGLSKEYEGPVNDANVLWVFDDRKIEFKMNTRGNTGLTAIYDFLVIPCQYERRGVAVGFNNNHMVNVVHYDRKAKRVFIIDNSDVKLRVQEWDWDDFHRRWDGSAIIIYAKKDRFPRYEADWSSGTR